MAIIGYHFPNIDYNPKNLVSCHDDIAEQRVGLVCLIIGCKYRAMNELKSNRQEEAIAISIAIPILNLIECAAS